MHYKAQPPKYEEDGLLKSEIFLWINLRDAYIQQRTWLLIIMMMQWYLFS